MGHRIMYLASVLAFLATPLLAQEIDVQKLRTEAEEKIERLASNPSLEDSLAAKGTDGVSLEAGTAEGQARIRLTGQEGWHLTLSSPASKDGPTDLASLDGLADGINLAFGWSWTKAPSPSEPKDFDEGIAICQRLGLGDLDCNNGAIEEKLQGKGNRADQRAFERLVFGKGPFQTGSFEAKVGRQRAEFFDGTTGDASTETNIGWSAGFNYGLHFQRSLLYGKLSFETDYEDQKKVQKCSTTDLPAGLERCKSLPFGEPEEVESAKATLGWRFFLRSIAFDPKITRNFETDVTGVELPIYLMNGGDQKFTGGVRLGWLSKVDEGQDKFSAAVFVSAPLDLDF
jgi:hypothetical protein